MTKGNERYLPSNPHGLHPADPTRYRTCRDRPTVVGGEPLGCGTRQPDWPAARRCDRAVPLSWPTRVGGAALGLDGIAAGGGGAARLSAAVARRAAGRARPLVHADGDGHRPDDLGRADRGGPGATSDRGSVGRVSRAANLARRHARPCAVDAAVGWALQPGHGRSGRLRPGERRDRRGDDRRRQYRSCDAGDDHRDRARDQQGRPGAGAGPRLHPHRPVADHQRRRLPAARRRAPRALSSAMANGAILPLQLESVCYDAAGRRLIDALSLSLSNGPRTVILGPNGAGKSLTLRLCHGLLAPTAGAVRWLGPGGAEAARRQAMVFQRPVMLRRSAAANTDHALKRRRIPYARRLARIREMLEETGLAPFARHAARHLSIGEQQRLALASAWATEPEVLFLD